MRFLQKLVAAPLVLAATLVPITSAVAAPTTSAAEANAVTNVPISFQVQNLNRSNVACESDGKTYTVRGHLIAPANIASSSNAVTLYLHGLGFGEFFWNFDDVAGYNYAENQARAGLTSVVIDRLGYDSSDKPEGDAICAGSRADIAHQMVEALRSGSYQVASAQPTSFDKVILAGHSYGGQIAEIAAQSFGNIDGLVVVAYSDIVVSKLAEDAIAYTTTICANGGLTAEGGEVGMYAPFGNPSGAEGALFADTDPAVLASALPKLNINPCADQVPFPDVAAETVLLLDKITVPVHLVFGGSDALFPPPAAEEQASLFENSAAVTADTIAGAGHALTLERSHSQFEASIAAFIRSVAPSTAPPTTPSDNAGTLLNGGVNARLTSLEASLAALVATLPAEQRDFATSRFEEDLSELRAFESSDNRNDTVAAFDSVKSSAINALNQSKDALADRLNRSDTDSDVRNNFFNNFNNSVAETSNQLEQLKNSYAATAE